MAARGRQGAESAEARLDWVRQHIAQPIDGDAHLLELLPELRQTQHRRRHLRHDHVEGDEATHRHPPLHHLPGTEQQHQS